MQKRAHITNEYIKYTSTPVLDSVSSLGGGYNSLFIGFLTGFENLYSLSFSRLRGNPEFNQLDLQPSAEDDKRSRSESQYFPSFSRLRGNPEINQLDLQPSAEDDESEGLRVNISTFLYFFILTNDKFFFTIFKKLGII